MLEIKRISEDALRAVGPHREKQKQKSLLKAGKRKVNSWVESQWREVSKTKQGE